MLQLDLAKKNNRGRGLHLKIAILVLHLFGGGMFLLVPGTVLHITIFPHEATDFTSSFLGKLFFTDVSNGFVAVVKIYNAKQLSETLTERKHSTGVYLISKYCEKVLLRHLRVKFHRIKILPIAQH